MPDDQDYAWLSALLSRPESWSELEAERVRALRRGQAEAAAAHDQRDKARVAAMREVVQQIDEVLAAWEATR